MCQVHHSILLQVFSLHQFHRRATGPRQVTAALAYSSYPVHPATVAAVGTPVWAMPAALMYTPTATLTFSACATEKV